MKNREQSKQRRRSQPNSLLERKDYLQINIKKKQIQSKVQGDDRLQTFSTFRAHEKEKLHISSQQIRKSDLKHEQNSHMEEQAKTLLIQQSQQFDRQMVSSKYSRRKIYKNGENTDISAFNFKNNQIAAQNNPRRYSYMKDMPSILMGTICNNKKKKHYHSNLIEPTTSLQAEKGVKNNKQLFHISNINLKDVSALYLRKDTKQKLKLDNYPKSCDDKEKTIKKQRIDVKTILNNRRLAINIKELIKPFSVSHQNLISMKMTHLLSKASFNRQKYHSCNVSEMAQYNSPSKEKERQQDTNQKVQNKSELPNLNKVIKSINGVRNDKGRIQYCFPQTFKPVSSNLIILFNKLQEFKINKYKKYSTRRNSEESEIISNSVPQHQILNITQSKYFNQHFKIKQKRQKYINLTKNRVRSSFSKNIKNTESDVNQMTNYEDKHLIRHKMSNSLVQMLPQQSHITRPIFIHDNILVYK